MVYKLNGKKYRQEELTFEELGKVREIVKGSFLDTSYLNEQNIVSLIDDMYDKGLLEQVFAIVLKPVKNHFMFWKNGVESPLKNMKTSEIARVCVDFFTLNFAWINNFLNTGNNLTSTIQTLNKQAKSAGEDTKK
jgi:hypothetical protein